MASDFVCVSANCVSRFEVAKYNISDADREAVMSAGCSKDLDVKLRNKLYNAMSRAFRAAEDGRTFIPAQVIAKYTGLQKKRGTVRVDVLVLLYITITSATPRT